ncbi:hypothetical protein A2U01_0012938 [Trifolium medium]|uniref:Transmembrane protein n=1 Tax=Trifolium medium TaxID=97028 RepID=A0A392MWT4_9FABA|nr:hypothetical protein [Trifolium medium]
MVLAVVFGFVMGLAFCDVVGDSVVYGFWLCGFVMFMFLMVVVLDGDGGWLCADCGCVRESSPFFSDHRSMGKMPFLDVETCSVLVPHGF